MQALGKIAFPISIMLAVVPGTAVAAQVPPHGSIVLLNGHIYTPSGWKQAVSVEDGRIVAIGSNGDIRARARTGVPVIDLGGKTVLPGLHDMHVHPMMAGLAARECHFSQEATPRQIFDAVAKCAAAKRPGEWITGGQWQGISFGDTPPNKSQLDKVAPTNPVLLTDVSGHSTWANSAALKLAGITRDTPDPQGGVIERDSEGEPTGILRESASQLVRAHLPPPTAEENATALKSALDQLLSTGITTLVDALVTPDVAKAYDDLYDGGDLAQEVRGCIVYGRAWGGTRSFDDFLASRSDYARPNFRPDCVKVFMDGVPLLGHTAALLDPYVDTSTGSTSDGRERGILMIQPSELNPLVTQWDKMGLTVKFHAVGDAASKAAIDAIAAARSANGIDGPTHDPAHLTLLGKDQIARAKRLRATLEFSPYLWFPTTLNDEVLQVVGKQRMERAWPAREAIDSGALVVIGSDWPTGTPTANPWIGIETLVTRRTPGDPGTGAAIAPREAITLKEAIDLFTIAGARQMGDAKERGSIETGKIADLIVLDRDPFAIPINDVHNTTVEKVLIDGRVAFSR